MLIKLFDIQNGKVVPSEHCYTLKSLKTIHPKKIYEIVDIAIDNHGPIGDAP